MPETKYRISFLPYLLILLLFNIEMKGQDIRKHQWQNRLLMVISEELSNKTLIRQLSALNACSTGLSERKILVYQILPDQYRISTGSGNKQDWKPGHLLYQQYGDSDESFEIILIGLDGGIKLRENDLLSCENLWSVIDQMPMRKAETSGR